MADEEVQAAVVDDQQAGDAPQDQKTSELYSTGKLPERFDNPGQFKGYGSSKPQNPLYQRSSDAYGALPPNAHTMPVAYHGKSQKFSQSLARGGMPRSGGFNTSVDKPKI